MKKILTSLFAIFIISLSLSAQTQFQWAKGCGGNNITGRTGPWDNTLIGMVVDKEGNTYVSGVVVENMTFGDSAINPPYGSFGQEDGLIAKYDKCGKLIWYHIVGGRYSDNFGNLSLSPDERYMFSVINLSATASDSIIIHMENKDTVIKSTFGARVKISTATGKIIKFWPSLVYPTGANYYPGNPQFMSPNRMVCYTPMYGNFNGSIKSAYEGIVAILDSNFNIIRAQQIDTGMLYYYENDYDIAHPPLEIDKYGNIYSEVVLQPSNPSNTLYLMDTSFNTLTHGDGIFFQLDTNLNIKRFKKENCMEQFFAIAGDDKLYLTGGMNNTFYYDNTYFTGSTSTQYTAPIYAKIDTSLNLQGYSYPSRVDYLPSTYLLSIATNKVYVSGLGYGNVKWGQDSITPITNTYQVGIWEFPRDSIRPTKVHLSNGFATNTVEPAYIRTDEQGNVIIAGTYTYLINTIGDTISANGGSTSANFFEIKWGLPCSDSIHALIAPLPATELVATATGPHAVHVAWQDDSRYENSFHLYRSPDGVSGWTLIDTVLANITQYTDVNVQAQTAYWYKVAAWNPNGESSYSNMDSALTWRTVGISETDATLPYINVYPNPTTSALHIDVYSIGAKDAEIHLTDMNGRQVSNSQWHLSDGGNKTDIQMAGFAPGIYYLTLQTGSDIVTRKVTKVE